MNRLCLENETDFSFEFSLSALKMRANLVEDANLVEMKLQQIVFEYKCI